MSNSNMFLTFLLCGLGAGTCAQEFTRRFYFVNLNRTWADAQWYCRWYYSGYHRYYYYMVSDLATVSNLVNNLPRPASYSGDAWIGLYRSSVVGYQNWAHGASKDLCPGIHGSGLWYGADCCNEYYFVCYEISEGQKTFHLVRAHYPYAYAQAHCRSSYTDLALIESEAENIQVKSLLQPVDTVWIHDPWPGRWAWSDRSSNNFSNWASGFPVEKMNHSCVVEQQNQTWREESCDRTLPFYCQSDNYRNPPLQVNITDQMETAKSETTMKVVKVHLHSDLDLTDPRNYKLLLEKVQTAINQTGAKVTWKSPPKKKTKKKTEEKKCPQYVV